MPSYVISGASRGIGFEFVKQISADPQNTVFGLVRKIEKSKDLVALQKSRKNIHVFEADLTKADTWKTAAAEVARVTGGTLDVLINDAAWVPGIGRSLDGYPEGDAQLEADFVDSFRVNVVGTIFATNAFLPLIRAKASTETTFTPKVITLGSAVGDIEFTRLTGLDIHASYTVFKAAMAAVMAKYAATHHSENIIFLTICPGLVDTSTESTAPPTPEEMADFTKVIQSFKRAAPEWNGKPKTPEESVKSMFSVIDNLTKKDSGAFLSHKGNTDWL